METYDPTIPKPIVFGAAVAAGVLVWTVVVHLGRALAEWYVRGGVARMLLAIVTFVLTIAVSAYGVMTAFMLLVEGPVILREDLTAARGAVLKLEAAAKAQLRIPEFEQVQARVNGWRQTLTSEILSPALCGVGPRAQRAITEIQADLPSVQVLAGTTGKRNCDAAYLKRVKAAYDEMIDKALKEHPLNARYRSGERAETLRQIADTVAADRQAVDAARSGLDGVTNFFFKLDLFYKTQAVLSRVESDYAAMYQRLAGLLDGAALRDLPPRIEVTRIEQLASFVQIVNVVLDRLNRISTWIYLTLTLAADLGMATLIAHAAVVHRHRDEDRRTRYGRSDFEIEGVTYIWSPVRSRAAGTEQ